MCVSPSLFISWLVFFFKQKTAYEMRISDWSSDVCSSDLSQFEFRFVGHLLRVPGWVPHQIDLGMADARHCAHPQFHFARHGFGDRAMRRRERHGDDGLGVIVDLHAIYKTEVIDTHGYPGIIDFLQRRDTRLTQFSAPPLHA